MGLFRFFNETVDFFISDIRKQTGKGFIATFTDKGNYGEFLSYKYLINTPGKRAYIHNCYIPTANGFTEIDFILIHETGIYVVESKNYSGWIFGDEKAKNWTQILAGGKTRNRFLNPIHQNAGHIKALKAFLKDYPDLRYYSLVVFSERCALKKVSCTLPDTYVVKREDLKRVFKKQIKEREKFPEKMLAEIAELLKPMCCVSEAEKAAHIERLKAMHVRAGKTMPSIEPIALAEVADAAADDGANDDEAIVIDEAMAAELTAFEAKAAAMPDDVEIAEDAEDAEAAEVEDTEEENPEDKEPEAIKVDEEQKTLEKDEEPKTSEKNEKPETLAVPPDMTCPRCHRPLIERKGKNGPFIGCTGFPHCRYTRNLG